MKKLVAYYSFSTTTAILAEEIARLLSADILEIIPEKPYSFDYNTATKEARQEIERGYCPKLIKGNESIDEYDTIFIGSPNWFKTIAPPVLSFLRGHNFKGKTIITFCTHGGGGFGEIENKIKEECKEANFLQGYETSEIEERDIITWLTSIGLIK